MHRVTALAITAVATAGLSGLGVSPALAGNTARHSGRHHGHASMNISFASGQASSAHWTRRQQAVVFNVGAATGGSTGPQPEFAELVVHHVPDMAPAQAPTFTSSGPGSPYLEVLFTTGGYLQDTSTGWSAFDSTGAALATATDYTSALAAEQGSGPPLSVERVTLVDAQAAGGTAYTDTITALQYNGVSLVPRTHRHGGH